jgi:hypothetical protein
MKMKRADYVMAFLVATVLGGAVVSVGPWIAHASSPTSESRAVVSASTSFVSGYDRRSRPTRTERVEVVDAAGNGFDLSAYGNLSGVRSLDRGDPVVLTRSEADGQILRARSPEVSVDLENHGWATAARFGWVLAAALALWIAVVASRGMPLWHRVVAIVAGATVGGFVLAAFIVPRPIFADDARSRLPNAMDGYGRSADEIIAGDEEPGYSERSVREVVPPGTPVAAPATLLISLPTVSTTETVILSVTGPAAAGLPAGADPALVADFATISVPVAVTTPEQSAGPGLDLLGDGRGLAMHLPTCGGAPDGERFACFAVPDGFAPRYLLVGGSFGIDDAARPDERPVAVDLR